MDSVYFLNKEIAEISAESFIDLKNSALQSHLKRARICLHHDHNDAIQEMIIVFVKGSYIRPHRHFDKVESIFIIEGKLAVVFFNEHGEVIHQIVMDRANESSTLLYRLSKNYWHAVIPLSEFVIVHEITQGPFQQNQDNFAPWSPQESDCSAVTTFIDGILHRLI